MVDGLLTEPEARAETAQATRRFVRRQRSWFRRDPRIHWLSPAPDLLARALTTIRVGGAG
jgi:tRNA dimethylallyltransferase